MGGALEKFPLELGAPCVYNVCSAEKYTKPSSVLLLRLVYFPAEQTLCGVLPNLKNKVLSVKFHLYLRVLCQKAMIKTEIFPDSALFNMGASSLDWSETKNCNFSGSF